MSVHNFYIRRKHNTCVYLYLYTVSQTKDRIQVLPWNTQTMKPSWSRRHFSTGSPAPALKHCTGHCKIVLDSWEMRSVESIESWAKSGALSNASQRFLQAPITDISQPGFTSRLQVGNLEPLGFIRTTSSSRSQLPRIVSPTSSLLLNSSSAGREGVLSSAEVNSWLRWLING